MRKKKPRTAKLDEVRVSKDGPDALIEFLDPDVSTTHSTLGLRSRKCSSPATITRNGMQHIPNPPHNTIADRTLIFRFPSG